MNENIRNVTIEKYYQYEYILMECLYTDLYVVNRMLKLYYWCNVILINLINLYT